MTYTNASLDILRRVHTAMVSDVCDDLLLENPMLAPAIQQLTGAEGPTVVGPAYPCLVEPTDEYVEIDTLLDMVEALPAGSVPVVVSVEGFSAALWGGLMSARAVERGAAAAVTNGRVRDIAQINGLGFPVFGSGRTALDIRRRGAMRAYDVTVELDGRSIAPGDVVLADSNGAAVLRGEVVDRVATECQRRVGYEQDAFESLRAGRSPWQVFDEHGQF
jgi:regulator of RNase E activity RraA